MKTCKCGETDLTKFGKNKRFKDGLQRYCKSCKKEEVSFWYVNNKEKAKETSKKHKQNNKLVVKDYIVEFLKENPCVKCGEEDIIVLQFDHLKDKKYAISDMISQGISLKRVVEEIEKCQVLCANCHARKTAIDFGSYRIMGV